MITNISIRFIIISLLCLINYISFCQEGRFQLLGGTTTITIITEDSIWIAADSKHTTKTKDGLIVNQNFLNKINQRKNVFFTITGSCSEMINQRKEVVFDSKSILLNSIDSTKTFESGIYSGIEGLIFSLNNLYKIMPPYLQDEFIKNEGFKVLEIILLVIPKHNYYIKVSILHL
ncbi:MAG: hypothetical protein IPI68_05095 [Chitinophagaceae bacterium]|nr:hypothetical protein [Chitinophagaceae bacterium]